MAVRHCLRAATVVAGLLFAAGAQAQTHMSPGLWEMQTTMKSNNAQMEAAMARMKDQLASMPPEKRAMVEQMMASKGAVVGANGNANTLRICITKEMSERDLMPQREGRCTHDASRSGNTIHVKSSCQGEKGGQPITSDGEFTLNGSTGFTGHSVTNLSMHGQPTQMQSEVSGKWLGADCGDVKPLQPPPAH